MDPSTCFAPLCPCPCPYHLTSVCFQRYYLIHSLVKKNMKQRDKRQHNNNNKKKARNMSLSSSLSISLTRNPRPTTLTLLSDFILIILNFALFSLLFSSSSSLLPYSPAISLNWHSSSPSIPTPSHSHSIQTSHPPRFHAPSPVHDHTFT